ncbi:NYN domain-containing protein [Microcoleus sp. FACHB-1515]|uniref:NYN domain-containing protein n=1 Tax=Cyanophyceae TaxID=3028117 RepID=UPI001686813A|nr:NYN domain-containing protein [Microcoleus sp. FACHB-1515]MBD2090998.1 NYN domain-containing protein [Microcoleus sp. FACHB-1515]
MPSAHPQALFLVDGYNVIGAWPDLQRLRDTEGLESARRGLVEALVGYSAFHDYDTRIVFDAQFQGNPGCREIVTQNLSVCYTDYRQTADTYIERSCALFRQDLRKFEQRLIVATSDRAQQLTVVGYGAEWISAQQLRHEVETSVHRVRSKQKQKRKSQSRFLANAIDPIAQQRLAQMRFGIRSDESR